MVEEEASGLLPSKGMEAEAVAVHTGGMEKLLTYPMPYKGITAQVPTHQKGLILCWQANTQFSGQNSAAKAESHRFCPEANSLV